MYAKTINIKSPKGFARLGGLFLIVGIIMLVVSVVTYIHEVSFARTAQVATGRVISVIQKLDDGTALNGATVSNSGTDSSYFPVVKFSVQGKDYVFTSSMGSNPPSYSQGESVQVAYNPQNPTEASINSWLGKWGMTVIALGIGVVMSLVGFFMVRFRKKIAAQNQVISGSDPTVMS